MAGMSATNPELPGVRVSGGAGTERVLRSDAVALQLWRHQLAPGTTVRVEGAAEDHLFYLMSGDLRANDRLAERTGMVSVGRLGVADLVVGPEGATVLHCVGDAASRPDRPGGCVHIVTREPDPVESPPHAKNLGAAPLVHSVYLDSSCPDCGVWLHKSTMPPDYFVPPHYHTEEEIIAVIHGGLSLGLQVVPAGDAVGVGGHKYYSFRTGPGGLTFLNFRQSDPAISYKGRPGEPRSERDAMRAMPPARRGHLV